MLQKQSAKLAFANPQPFGKSVHSVPVAIQSTLGNQRKRP
jgi:hypothetical protein